MTPVDIKVGLIQMRCDADAGRNLERARQFIRDAARAGAGIVCLPELFLGPYFCQTEDHRHFARAEPIPGPTTESLGKLARELNVVIIASVFEKRTAGLYHNSCVLLDADGSYLGKYRKMHVPDDPLYYEKFYFTPGDTGFRSFSTKFGKLGVLICWDQWFPEAARLTALAGADILFFPTAIGWHPSEKQEYGQQQHASWETMQRSHAIANGCYVVSVNRTGHEGPDKGGIEFWGQSFVSDTNGQVLARAAVEADEVLVVELNLAKIDLVRTHWPFLRDRRIDAYDGLSKRFLD